METYYWRVAMNAGAESDWTRPIQVASLGPVSLPHMPPRGADRQPIALDAENVQLLASVNARINNAILFMPSQDRNGPPAWRMPIAEAGGGRAYGDCKDYVLEKRRALLAAGVPEAALTIALVENNQRKAHAVLLVDTDRGELVLDSADSRILPWNQARYHWVSRQVRGELLQWVNIPQRYS
jgi:predicted transglutaminase-like cysteine proteinase